MRTTGPQAKPSRDLTTPGRPEALMREGWLTDLAGGCRPSGRTALGLHVNPDLHAKLILGVTPITAREGYRLLWRSGDSYTNEVTITDYPVGRVEFYPSRSRHLH